jgi:hypothetical protein
MVAGIIAAAGADELTIAHPTDEATVETTALILGGPALYLACNAPLKWALWNRLPRSRLVAICALVLLVAATLVVIFVSLWDMRAERMKFTGNIRAAILRDPANLDIPRTAMYNAVMYTRIRVR